MRYFQKIMNSFEDKKVIDYDTIKKLVDYSNNLESECLKLKSYGLKGCL